MMPSMTNYTGSIFLAGKRREQVAAEKPIALTFTIPIPTPTLTIVFYLSQRGTVDSGANNIVRATITADNKLQFKVIHSADADSDMLFPGDIEVKHINTTKVLLVNSFRDFINWQRSQVFFGITARTLTEPFWQKSCTAQMREASYYRFAANHKGTVMVSSFYANRVHIFHLQPQKSFVCEKSIE